MKPFRLLTLGFLVMALSSLNSVAQTDSIQKTAIAIGIDFVRFNRDWIYYNNYLEPVDGTQYAFDLIPSLFISLPVKKISLRFKYEFFKKPYSFVSNSIDTYHQVDGNLIEHRISVGIEKNLYNKQLRIYYLIDGGVSFSNFRGLYSYNNINYFISSDPFNINGITLFLQPGLGVKVKLSKRLDFNLESAFWFGKGYDKDDNNNVNPNFRFIPRPISLLGFSYKFINKKPD